MQLPSALDFVLPAALNSKVLRNFGRNRPPLKNSWRDSRLTIRPCRVRGLVHLTLTTIVGLEVMELTWSKARKSIFPSLTVTYSQLVNPSQSSSPSTLGTLEPCNYESRVRPSALFSSYRCWTDRICSLITKNWIAESLELLTAGLAHRSIPSTSHVLVPVENSPGQSSKNRPHLQKSLYLRHVSSKQCAPHISARELPRIPPQ